MYKKQKSFVAVIPARVGSKGIKKKNIFPINGHPLVSYSIEAAKKSIFIKDVFVSTDGRDIEKVAKKYGAKIIKRPKCLSNDVAQIEPTILHAIKYIEKVYKEEIDNVVLLQPTSPLRGIDDLDNAIKKFIKDKADSLFSCVNLHPHVWRDTDSKILPLGHNPSKRQNRQDMRHADLIEDGSIYVTKKKIYKTKKNRLGGKISKYIMENYSVFQIDSKKDLNFISMLLKSKFVRKFKIINPKKI
jgi:N-acylneuraminate cytidylyltransferase|tara:strand:+ start:513 stop:1244 length:732 start_codon:yes stop_codon:yes gene_type:complete